MMRISMFLMRSRTQQYSLETENDLSVTFIVCRPSWLWKVKCVLTGMKKFQYTHTYELQAYVDDGTLIREILVDHNVVQEGIGHSPEEVKAAISSPDKTIVRNMKEKMKQFQKFLTNFEGILLIEMRLHDLPIALEMKQGCTQSDAWLLLRRMKASPPTWESRHASPAARTSQYPSIPARTSQHLSSLPPTPLIYPPDNLAYSACVAITCNGKAIGVWFHGQCCIVENIWIWMKLLLAGSRRRPQKEVPRTSYVKPDSLNVISAMSLENTSVKR